MDGSRVLVDRLWPRGVSKADLHIDTWTRDLAPTDELRHWFGHDPDRWEEFRTRYRNELAAHTGAAAGEFTNLVDRVAAGRVTLVYGAHDCRYNNAVVLREYLDEHVNEHANEHVNEHVRDHV